MLSGQWLVLLLNARVFYEQQGVRHPRQTDPWIRVPRRESTLLGNADGGGVCINWEMAGDCAGSDFLQGVSTHFLLKIPLSTRPAFSPGWLSHGYMISFPFSERNCFLPLAGGEAWGVS